MTRLGSLSPLSPPRAGSLSSIGFTLLEVLISLLVLTVGLLTLLSILQRTLRASEPVEFETRAALLAQSVLEGIRSDPGAFPFLPGVNTGTWPVIEKSFYRRDESLLSDETGGPFDLNRTNQPSGHRGKPARLNLPLVMTVPGNGVDDDSLLDDGRWLDQRRIDFDPRSGLPTISQSQDGLDDEMVFFLMNLFGRPPGASSVRDYDGNIQEDVNEAFLGRVTPNLLLGGSAADQDGDGLWFDTGDSSFLRSVDRDRVRDELGLFPDGDFAYDPQRGIDEEFANGEDDDGDDLIDEDLTLPSQFARISSPSDLERINPYNYFPTLAGNGLDDDGDGEAGSPLDPRTGKAMADRLDNDNNGQTDEGIDEEIWDGIDNDGDGLVDEDCKGTHFPFNPAPFPSPNEEYSFQLSVRRLAVAGDGFDNDGDGRIDEEFANSWDEDRDGLTDEDLREFPAPNTILVTVFVMQGDDRQDNDGDGWIDEEAQDGLDNDFDGLVDEDFFRRSFRTTGLVRVR